jgi:hypothetical protein
MNLTGTHDAGSTDFVSLTLNRVRERGHHVHDSAALTI